MASKNNPTSRKKDIVVQELKGEVLIYDLKINKALCLNETSGLVWQLCDGNRSVKDISIAVSKKLNSPVTEDLVWLALDQLKEENLLSNSDEVVSNFNGMSRREVIRKVGLGTMIALPFVTGLIAPSSASAQSCSQICECADAFVLNPAIPVGSVCSGPDLSFACSVPGCVCRKSDFNPASPERCSV